MNHQYGIILTTVPSEELGRKIAQNLLNEKLAACINLFPVESFYTWEDKLNCDREYQLIIKTRLSLVETLITKIQSLHSYEVPEIITLPIINGSTPYLQWLGNSTQVAR